MAIAVGSRLGHYAVDALIGEGGLGQVYRYQAESAGGAEDAARSVCL